MNSFHSFNEEHQEDEEIRCRVCSYFFSSITKPYLLPCNHNLCLHCIDTLIRKKRTFCPICKISFNKNDKSNFQVNYAFLNLVLKILKSKIILCIHCNKIYFWKEHYDKCDQKYFTNTNKLLSEIKKVCEESYNIIKLSETYKNILKTSKSIIYKTIHFSINKIQEKFVENYSKFIENLFLSNITQINIDNSKKEIIQFLEICKENNKLFNNINSKELDELFLNYDNKERNDLFNNFQGKNEKLKSSGLMFKSALTKKTKKFFSNNKKKEKAKEEEDEDITINYDDEYDEILSNEYLKLQPLQMIKNSKKNFISSQNNKSNNNILDDMFDDIEEPKTVNKIIVGPNGVQVYSEKKKVFHSPQNSINYNSNFNINYTSNPYLNNYVNNLINEKSSQKGKRNLEIIRKRNLFYTQSEYFNSLDNQKNERNKTIENNKSLLLNNEINNSIQISNNNNVNKKKENNEIQTMNKIIKSFNKIKDIISKMKKYTNEYINTNNKLMYQIEENSKKVNPKIVLDYCLLLNEISYDFHQSYKRYIISYIENSTTISLFDTRNEKYITKNFRETLNGFPSLNHSLSVIFDDFDLFFISGGIEFANYDSSNLLLSFRWSSMKIEFIDKMPQKRAFHSSIYFDNKLYIIGGMGEKNNFLYECYCFHITKKKWEKIPNLNTPRLNPSLCIYNNNYLYVIRGSNKIESIDTIEFINIKNFNEGWTLFKPYDPSFSWFGCDTSLSITISKNKILIFGGRDKNGKLFHHSYFLDVEKRTVYRGKDILVSANFKFCGSLYQDKVIAIDWKNSTNNKNHGRHIYDLKKKKWLFECK